MALMGYSPGRGKAQSLFFVHIRLLREPLTPEMLPRLQALSPDLLLRRLVASSDPNDSELCLRMAVLNYKLVPDLYFASVTTQPHTMISGIESVREMALLTPGDPETHWHNRFGSLRPPSSCATIHAHWLASCVTFPAAAPYQRRSVILWEMNKERRRL
jgi:hypothetical protein